MPKHKLYGQIVQAAAAPVTSFADTFIRADSPTLGPDWIRTSCNIPAGGGNGGTAWAEVSSNQCLLQTLTGAGFTQRYDIAWIPLQVYYNVQNLAGYFVQCTFQTATTSGWGLMNRYNHNMQNGVTQNEGADFYSMVFNGRIDKVVGGGASATIGAATWAQVAGDVLRFEVLTVGATQVLQSVRNGVVLQNIVDATAFRITNGGPAISVLSIATAPSTSRLSAFSCGPITALTP